jgi:hypothetical protein
MIHYKLIDDFLAGRNLLNARTHFLKPLIFSTKEVNMISYSLITSGVVEFTRVEQIREY